MDELSITVVIADRPRVHDSHRSIITNIALIFAKSKRNKCLKLSGRDIKYCTLATYK